MDLSIVIVNYNVKYFLEQCLHAVSQAITDMDAEIFVVDNCSADGSVQMIKDKFPQVKLIENTTNHGFAKANNQAVRLAAGRYILLLNPDTVVQDDTFVSCIGYMDANPNAGCMGVKMIDGIGRYLPESKRALPTPLVAFYKVFGLSRLFPRSRRFAQYHLGYLDRDKIHKVDVISGAFMLIRKEVLQKTGLLDEDYFMYGEDIDFSYRVKQAGYDNIYYPLTTIIHYKGESTKKSTINYVLIFYRAMIIFAKKHFKESTFRYYSFFIHIAIYFRAGISILNRFIERIITPLSDALIIYAGFMLFLPFWEKHHFGEPDYYPPEYMQIAVPGYILIWVFSVFLATAYEKKVKLADLARGVLTGTVIILVIYALLPESWRFSRALILIGTIWVLLTTIVVRYLLSRLDKNTYALEWSKKRKRIIIVGNAKECQRVYSLINQTQIVPELLGFVNNGDKSTTGDYIGHLDQIDEIVRINQADELVFCGASVSSKQIIKTMLQFTDTGIEFKIAPPESISVIGSNSNDTAGDLYVLHFNTLSRKLNRQKKWLLDKFLAVIFLALSPLLLVLVKERAGLLRNIFRVMFGMASWVGYHQTTGGEHPGLPEIKAGVLTPAHPVMKAITDREYIEKVNLSYAKDYRLTNDIRIILSNIRYLGRNPFL